MPDDWNLPLIIENFEAAAQGGNWQTALDIVSEQVGGHGAAIIPLQGSAQNFPASQSFGEAMERYVHDGWYKQDVRFLGVPNLVRRGFTVDADFISEAAMDTHPYYQEWLRPFGLRWFCSLHIHGANERFALSIQRAPHQGPFAQLELQKLLAVSQSISRAFAVGAAINYQVAEGALGAFEISGRAVVILDRLGRAIRTNRAAEKLFDNDFRIRRQKLWCGDPASAKKLSAAIEKAGLQPLSAIELRPVPISRTNKAPLFAYVSRAIGVSRDVFSAAQIFVVLHDPMLRKIPDEQLVQDLLALTPAEARLACLLAAGTRLPAAALMLKVSYETVRHQLKSIFAKLHIHTQADLTALVLALYVES